MKEILNRPELICGGIIGIGLLGYAYLRARLAGREHNTTLERSKFEIIDKEQEAREQDAKDYSQMGQLLRKGVNPNIVARLFGIGNKKK